MGPGSSQTSPLACENVAAGRPPLHARFIPTLLACRSALADLHGDAHDSLTGPRVTDRDLLATLCTEVAIADAVYEKDAAAMCRSCVLKPDEVREQLTLSC